MMKPGSFKRYWKTLLAVAVPASASVAAPEWCFPAALSFGAGLLAMAEWHHRPNWKALLRHAIESAPVGICMFDFDGRVILSNQYFTAMYGLSQAALGTGSTCRDSLEKQLSSFAPERRLEYVHDFDGANSERSAEYIQVLNDGRFISVSRHVMACGGSIEVHRDITGERLAEERANDAMQALIEKQYAIDQAVIVAITDIKGTITYVNENFCRISEYSSDELVGRNHRILKSGHHSEALFREMYRCLAQGRVWRGELCNRSKSGRLYWVDTVITPQLGSQGKPIAYTAIRIDITARKNAEAQIAFAATHDALTGLLNRSGLMGQAKAKLQPDGVANFAVHLIDLDGFKGVNDTLGHSAGDDLLRQVSARLRSATDDDNDLVARLGGDEFAIIQQMHSSGTAPLLLGEAIVKAIAEPFVIDDQKVAVGASIGTALWPEHGATLEDLLKKADLALYEVKADKGNGCRLYQPAMLRVVEEEKSLDIKLRKALAHEEFELHYQPVIDMKTRSLRAAEALVRWRANGNELVSPSLFIPAAERSGLILPLSEWIIERACHDAASWSSDVQVAINVSAIQFKGGNLFEAVMRALLGSGLSPNRLQIEVTETALLENQPGQLSAFRQLKSLGIKLVLDDFGTGYSSASYLTNFPFDRIKIDKSFIHGLPKRECAAVITSAVALAKGLGITITAEGIETESQFRKVSAMGIDFGQGYLFSPAVPLDEFISMQGSSDAFAMRPKRVAGEDLPRSKKLAN